MNYKTKTNNQANQNQTPSQEDVEKKKVNKVLIYKNF